MKGIQLRMGTTPLAPDSLKREFRENLTTGLKEVRSPEFSSELELASDGKQAIGPMAYIYLETPFFYDPSQGNLIFDVLPVAGFDIRLDFHPSGKGEYAIVFADAGFGNQPEFGDLSSGGFITVFGMQRVPEPSVVGLAALGGAALLAASRQRKVNP